MLNQLYDKATPWIERCIGHSHEITGIVILQVIFRVVKKLYSFPVTNIKTNCLWLKDEQKRGNLQDPVQINRTVISTKVKPVYLGVRKLNDTYELLIQHTVSCDKES